MPFRLNSAGMEALLKSDRVREVVRARAEDVLAAAKSSAPVESGGYRDSLRLVDDETDRAVVRVTATVPYARKVEARYGVLSRAMGR